MSRDYDDFDELDDYLYVNHLDIYADSSEEDVAREEEEDDYIKSQLVDMYGVNEDDVEYMDEYEREELLDELETSSSSVYGTSKAPTRNVSYSTPPKKKSIAGCIGTGILVSFLACILTGGNIPSSVALILMIVGTVIAYKM